GVDELDPTSLDYEWDFTTNTALDNLTVGVTEIQPDNVSDDAWNSYQAGIRALEAAGITTTEVTLEAMDQARQAAHIIGAAEFSANLAKFDGIRFGNRVTPDNATVQDVITASRGAGFGYETKRRI